MRTLAFACILGSAFFLGLSVANTSSLSAESPDFAPTLWLVTRRESSQSGFGLANAGLSAENPILRPALSGGDFIAGKAEMGGFGTQKGTMAMRRSWGKLTNHISADMGTSLNNYPLRVQLSPGNVVTGQMKNNELWFTNASYAASYSLDSNQRIGGSLRYQGQDKGLFLKDVHADSVQRTRAQRDGFVLNAHYDRLGPDSALNLRVEAIGEHQVGTFTDPDSMFSYVGSNMRSRSPHFEATVVSSWQALSGLRLSALIGGSYRSLTMKELAPALDGEYRPDAQRYSGSVGAELHGKVQEWLDARLRYVHTSEYDAAHGFKEGEIAIPPSEGYDHFPRAEIELSVKPWKDVALIGGVQYQQRNPSFTERYGTSGLILGRPGLRPEVSLSGEAGICYEGGRVSTSLIGKLRQFRNKIRALPSGNGYFTMENLGEVHHVGGEWSVSLRPCDWLTIRNQFALNHSTVIGSDGSSMQEPLTPLVENRMGLELSYRKITLGHDLLYRSSYHTGNPAQVHSFSSPILDAHARYQFSRFMSVSYRLENYLDVYNEDFAEIARPGRMHFLSLDVLFLSKAEEK